MLVGISRKECIELLAGISWKECIELLVGISRKECIELPTEIDRNTRECQRICRKEFQAHVHRTGKQEVIV